MLNCPQRGLHWTLTVQKISGTAGDDGHIDLTDSDNWTEHGKIRGLFVSRGGREAKLFDQVQAEITDIVEVVSTNFTRSITPDMRIVDGDAVYNIQSAYDVDKLRQTVRLHLIKVL